MKRAVLEFERPIAELEDKVAELRSFGESNDVDVEHGITVLLEKIEETRKRVYASLTPIQKVQLARHPERPYSLDYLDRLLIDFIELKGDRRYADDQAIVGGFGRFRGQKVMFIGQQKGRDVKENVRRNFGMCHPEGYRKALRLMQLADKAGTPIITFIDTPGAYPGLASEERHVGEAIALNLREMFNLTVPVISVVIGEGGSGGALGIGCANRVLIMQFAYYSVITPEGCAAILWKSQEGDNVATASKALKITSDDLLNLGIVDEIVPEPEGGANQDYDTAASKLGDCLEKHLKTLGKLTADELMQDRYDKFRKMGNFLEA